MAEQNDARDSSKERVVTPLKEGFTYEDEHGSITIHRRDMKKLDISHTNGVLSIKGEKKHEIGKDELCYCSERYSGSFERSFRIPGEVKGEEIEATYKDGVLRVALSKSEESQVKKIEVKH